jgi:hypothetical protein
MENETEHPLFVSSNLLAIVFIYNNVTQNGRPLPPRSGHSAIAARNVSRGISSDRPGCYDGFGMPCPPKQPTVYIAGG